MDIVYILIFYISILKQKKGIIHREKKHKHLFINYMIKKDKALWLKKNHVKSELYIVKDENMALSSIFISN